MNLVEILLRPHVGASGEDAIAYVDSDIGEFGYNALFRAAGSYARLLADAGVAPGSRGMVLADDSAATVTAILGLWWNGCVAVPVNPALSDAEIGFIAADSSVAFVHLDVAPTRSSRLDAVLPDTARLYGDDVRQMLLGQRHVRGLSDPPPFAPWAHDREMLLQYTSGSTGTPKGVPHRAAALASVAAGFGRVAALTAADTVLSTAKLSFAYGFGNSLLLPLTAGATTVLIRGAVDAPIVMDALRRHRPTVLFSVPRLYAGLEALHGGRSDSLRLAVCAGEALPADLAERTAHGLGVPVVNSLGTTEALYIVVATNPSGPVSNALGRPVPGVSATLRDPEGQLVEGDDVEGRLHIAGPTVATGYLNRPEATEATFVDGGAYTGDIVRRGRDGVLHYLGRGDDFLNLGGFKVAPAEIENAVRAVAGVRDCAVVGIADGAGLQQAVAFVVAADGVVPTTLRRAVTAALRANVAPFKRPGRIEVVDALPTTWTGKLARNKLRSVGAG